jgi:hypothetical protein
VPASVSPWPSYTPKNDSGLASDPPLLSFLRGAGVAAGCSTGVTHAMSNCAAKASSSTLRPLRATFTPKAKLAHVLDWGSNSSGPCKWFEEAVSMPDHTCGAWNTAGGILWSASTRCGFVALYSRGLTLGLPMSRTNKRSMRG